MINQDITNPGTCIKCASETGAEWKTLCIACWRSRTPDEVRAQRQAKIDRKVARLNKWADSRDIQAENKMSSFNTYRKDWSWLTQPANASSAFGRSRQRVMDRYDSGMKLSIEADDMRKKAEYLQKTGAVVKGDAEKKRQAKRDHMDTLVKVGDVVQSWIVGECTIVKINKKTYTVRNHRTGNTFTQDKSFIRIPKREEVKI
jgi:hypothetical protein